MIWWTPHAGNNVEARSPDCSISHKWLIDHCFLCWGKMWLVGWLMMQRMHGSSAVQLCRLLSTVRPLQWCVQPAAATVIFNLGTHTHTDMSMVSLHHPTALHAGLLHDSVAADALWKVSTLSDWYCRPTVHRQSDTFHPVCSVCISYTMSFTMPRLQVHRVHLLLLQSSGMQLYLTQTVSGTINFNNKLQFYLVKLAFGIIQNFTFT